MVGLLLLMITVTVLVGLGRQSMISFLRERWNDQDGRFLDDNEIALAIFLTMLNL